MHSGPQWCTYNIEAHPLDYPIAPELQVFNNSVEFQYYRLVYCDVCS
jgi:hypothetical protein